MERPRKANGRRREIAGSGRGLGTYRYGLLCDAADKIVDAFRQGFYLEAVTLVESLLCERLESRLNFHKPEEPGFCTLGRVITQLRQVEKDEKFADVLESARRWKDKRNNVLHELAKTAEGDRRPFWVKHSQSRSVVAEGADLLLRIHGIDVENRNPRGRVPATYPDAFEPLKLILLATRDCEENRPGEGDSHRR